MDDLEYIELHFELINMIEKLAYKVGSECSTLVILEDISHIKAKLDWHKNLIVEKNRKKIEKNEKVYS